MPAMVWVPKGEISRLGSLFRPAGRVGATIKNFCIIFDLCTTYGYGEASFNMVAVIGAATRDGFQQRMAPIT